MPLDLSSPTQTQMVGTYRFAMLIDAHACHGDLLIRWQVLQDLLGASKWEVDGERKRIATEGWGAGLLAAQSAEGRWANAVVQPEVDLHYLHPPTHIGASRDAKFCASHFAIAEDSSYCTITYRSNSCDRRAAKARPISYLPEERQT